MTQCWGDGSGEWAVMGNTMVPIWLRGIYKYMNRNENKHQDAEHLGQISRNTFDPGMTHHLNQVFMNFPRFRSGKQYSKSFFIWKLLFCFVLGFTVRLFCFFFLFCIFPHPLSSLVCWPHLKCLTYFLRWLTVGISLAEASLVLSNRWTGDPRKRASIAPHESSVHATPSPHLAADH